MSRKELGYTLVELMVGMALFATIGLGVVSYLTQTFGRLSVDNRASQAAMELRNGLDLLSTEFRIGSSVSPYLPGNNPALVTCGSNVSVTPTTLRFLVVHDDSTSPSGLRPIYVGYRYDPATRELLRGEIASTSSTSCAVPAGDPTAAATAQTVARNVVAIDTNNDGVTESVFSYTSPRLTVNLGVQVTGPRNLRVTQALSTTVFSRTL